MLTLAAKILAQINFMFGQGYGFKQFVILVWLFWSAKHCQYLLPWKLMGVGDVLFGNVICCVKLRAPSLSSKGKQAN